MSGFEKLSPSQRNQVGWCLVFWFIGILLIGMALWSNWWMLWATGVLVVYAGTWRAED